MPTFWYALRRWAILNSCASPSNDEKPSVPNGSAWQKLHLSPPSAPSVVNRSAPAASDTGVKTSLSGLIGFGGYRTREDEVGELLHLGRR